MPKLGMPRVKYVYEDGDEKPGEIHYRDPTPKEWSEFQVRFARALQDHSVSIKDGEKKIEVDGGEAPQSITDLCIEFGRRIVTAVANFEAPDDCTQLESLERYGASILAEIGQEVFTMNGGRIVRSKPREPASGRTTKDGSARSSSGSASTSS